MEIEINKKTYKKKKMNPMLLSIGFLLFTILLTTGLYFYNVVLENKNNELADNISQKEESIKDLEKNKSILAFNLYSLNKTSINRLEEYSQIPMYLDHLSTLSRKYNIDFKGFNYSAGDLKTIAISRSDGTGINYEKVVRFIRDYRKNEDLSSLFDLKLVKEVKAQNEGVNNVFNINLELKNNISKIIEKSKEKKKQIEKQKEEERLKRQEEIRKKIEKVREMNKKTQSGSIQDDTQI